MLKIALLASFFFYSISSYACWLGKGQLSIDGETFPLHQKFELGKDYVIPAGPFLLQLRLQEKEKKLHLFYSIQEKKGLKITSISRGEEEDIEKNKPKEIFAKGLPGSPNSIITFTFIDI